MSVIILGILLCTLPCSSSTSISETEAFAHDPSHMKISYSDALKDEAMAVAIQKEKDDEAPKRHCSLFGSRVSEPEHSLINCTWYSKNACCKRIEVTSVFQAMPILRSASKKCKQLLNFMMCYFCCPDQNDWYHDNRISVCADFCRAIYTNCRTASVDEGSVADLYDDGEALCKSQNFKIVEGHHNCFYFDPSVFGASSQVISTAFSFIAAFGGLLILAF